MPNLAIASTEAPNSPAAHTPNGSQPVFSVGRALNVLDGFLLLDRPATLTEITRVTGLSKSTTYRLIKQLVDSDYLVRKGSEYSLSLRVFRLGSRYSRQGHHALREIAAPHLGSLFQHAGMMVNLAVRDGSAVVYLDRIQSLQTPNAPGGIGARLPIAATALGKAILSVSPDSTVREILNTSLVRMTPRTVMGPGLVLQQLQRAASDGFAMDKEEAALGLHCVAAPIVIAGSPIGAISVSGGAGRLQPATVAPLVRRAAERISQEFLRRIE